MANQFEDSPLKLHSPLQSVEDSDKRSCSWSHLKRFPKTLPRLAVPEEGHLGGRPGTRATHARSRRHRVRRGGFGVGQLPSVAQAKKKQRKVKGTERKVKWNRNNRDKRTLHGNERQINGTPNGIAPEPMSDFRKWFCPRPIRIAPETQAELDHVRRRRRVPELG